MYSRLDFLSSVTGGLLAVSKVGGVFPMVVASKLAHAEFGPNDHREDVPHFKLKSSITYMYSSG